MPYSDIVTAWVDDNDGTVHLQVGLIIDFVFVIVTIFLFKCTFRPIVYSNVGSIKDRFSTEKAEPPIDPSQDWVKLSGQETNGYTCVTFKRALTNSDDLDIDIPVIY